ncbi:MAG: 4-hydroxy-tetrahydrodipicolinate synthase [Wenzhouxiangellaceae bacterium]
MNDRLIAGSIVALATPFEADGQAPDYAAWRALLQWHAGAGTDAVVVAGTTGESATLEAAERDGLLEHALDEVGGRMRVIAGTGASSTALALAQSRRAAELGADAVLVVTPYYNRPPQRGLLAHYRAIADQCPVPVVVYNVPGRTACDLAPETMLTLAEHPNIAGIKEAVADMDRVQRYAAAGVAVASGDDPSALEAMRHGAVGVISVAANVVPESFARMCRLAGQQRYDEAAVIERSMRGLFDFLSVESNPVPVKWVLARLGQCNPALRLPLVELDPAHHASGEVVIASIPELNSRVNS